MRTKKPFYPYTLWMAIFVIVPLIMVIWFSFTDNDNHFTLSNFKYVLDSLPTLLDSLKIAFISTLICLLLAYPFSYIMSKTRISTQRMLNTLVMLPMWMNFILRICAWVIILRPQGVLDHFLGVFGFGQNTIYHSETAIIIGIVYNFLPFMILPIYTTMAKIDRSLIEAGEDLGCNGFQVLRRVIFPLSLPGVITGITMVFVPAASTIVIGDRLGGYSLIGDVIDNYYKGQSVDMHIGSTLSLVLMIIILISIAVMNHFDNGDDLAVI